MTSKECCIALLNSTVVTVGGVYLLGGGGERDMQEGECVRWTDVIFRHVV